MDNITHGLVGATLSKVGLDRTTPLATATLVLAANAPDIDVLAYLRGPYYALAFRRGITHGVPALLFLPFVVTAAILTWDRWVRRRRRPDAPPVRAGPTLGLAALGVATHPVLDWMNTYGMRWWMPFDTSWTYGDALFIIDPWLWLVLGVACALPLMRSGRERAGPVRVRGRRVPTALALLALVYILGMVGANRWASREVWEVAGQNGGPTVESVMVAPHAANPFSGDVVVTTADGYRRGSYRWMDASRARVETSITTPFLDAGEGVSPAVARAVEDAAWGTPEASNYRVWSRLPFVRVEIEGGGYRVRIGDARYEGRGSGSLTGPRILLDRNLEVVEVRPP